ncbi:Sds3-like-domain-containing protein [Phycomyces blakesleeanus]|uniref:Sds3-like-domain-containing protein n=1 Tax=Phycomyces blakesleeanus TaxID=4837 RepID=A0ABR3AN68_PHYBL
MQESYIDYDDPYHSQYATRWGQDESTDVNQDKVLRRLHEFNDLITWMDREFWEQSEKIYQEKLKSLQEELQSIQEGTHSAFKEVVSDLEHKREKTIQDATYFSTYQLLFAKKQYDKDMAAVDGEYEKEQNTLHDTLMATIEDRRKQIKEDKEDSEDSKTQDIFKDAYARISHKRSLRRRTPFDRQNNMSPSRHESRRRQNRISTPHNIHATPTSKEEEELASEFMSMKTRRQGNLAQSRRS